MELDRAESRASGFRWLVLATCAITYALIIVGAIVRATGSGDACPDWPRCHGDLLPPLQTHVLIEFSHRLLASVVGVLVAAIAVGAWRTQRRSPLVLWGSIAAVGLVIGQIALGGATVLNDLSPGLVTAHLAMAALLLATLIVLALLVTAPMRQVAPREGAAAFRNLAFIAALATFALMLTGSYVSGSGAGLAFTDWPLFNGKLMPDGGRLAMIHATHRFTALAIGIILSYVGYRAWRMGYRPVVHGAMFALVLYVAQAFVGAANIWTLLQPAAVAAHVALAAALWATLVTLAYFAQRAAGRPMQQRTPALSEATPSSTPRAAVEPS